MARKRSQTRPAPAQVHELQITLVDSKPPIWRRVAVASDIRLSDLHDVIQIVMGWTNSHLHQFVLPRARSTPAVSRMPPLRRMSDLDFELDDTEDEQKVHLVDVAPRVKSKLVYEYDFGDSWEHLIEVKKITPPTEGVTYPVCLDGQLACPPDDCGGIFGYYHMLEAVKDPKHEDHDDLAEWLGEDFDPERFDLAEVNALLKRYC